jgi:hypothetical protein
MLNNSFRHAEAAADALCIPVRLNQSEGKAGGCALCRKPTAARKPKPTPGPPTRHSRRQGGEAPAQLSEQEAQLAAIYVDGVCPKCGKVRCGLCQSAWELPLCCLGFRVMQGRGAVKNVAGCRRERQLACLHNKLARVHRAARQAEHRRCSKCV